MHHPVKVFLLLAAAFATGWAAMSWALSFDADFKAAAITAILALGVKEYLDYRDSEQVEQKYLWESGREDVWDRRDAEAELEWLREVD